jgi:hypothetical protein
MRASQNADFPRPAHAGRPGPDRRGGEAPVVLVWPRALRGRTPRARFARVAFMAAPEREVSWALAGLAAGVCVRSSPLLCLMRGLHCLRSRNSRSKALL